MKQVKYAFLTLVLGLGLTSCGDSFLTQHPEGGTLLEDQYQKLSDKVEGAIRGIYTRMYEYGSHMVFGQRSIDMYGDIQCGDMAMKRSSYGWFEDLERGYFYAIARSYIWSYYYEIINLTNLCARSLEDELADINAGLAPGAKPTNTTIQFGYQYGQVLALRGWAYAGLLNYYCNPMDQLSGAMDDELAVPIYTETELKIADLKGVKRSTVSEVYDLVYEDLSQAIELLDVYGKKTQRSSKLEIDADVARIILAYAMLNQGDERGKIYNSDTENAYTVAFKLAKEVIDGNHYPMMKQSELTTTGFSDVNAANWMWGQDVTVETTTALGSFFGQVDIHTYSYAAAGDTKGIDENLYKAIVATGWDARKNWFRSGSEKFPYCPDGKFYCPKTKSVTALAKVDRDWLCDNIFMRVEVAYLIAAEAAYRNNDDATAVNYLKELCYERVLDDKTTADVDTWFSTTSVKDALIYNWRVEMWGEGYGLQTFRRLSKSAVLGSNHISRGNSTITVENDTYYQYQCEIPSTEIRYNPELAKTELTQAE